MFSIEMKFVVCGKEFIFVGFINMRLVMGCFGFESFVCDFWIVLVIEL